MTTDHLPTAEKLTLEQLNQVDEDQFVALLDGIYDGATWIGRSVFASRPFKTTAALHQALVEKIQQADASARVELVHAQSDLTDSFSAKPVTQGTKNNTATGLIHCTAEQFESIQSYAREYRKRFGFPFVLALCGPRGSGLDPAEVIDTLGRRLNHSPDAELSEALRNIHRTAEVRLNQRFRIEPCFGNRVWDQAQALATHSDPGFRERGELTVTYLTDAHRACAAQLMQWMHDAGFDQVSMDAVGNVVGVYEGKETGAKRLLTGSHYDTVRNGGKYDGRLGILVPICCVRQLSAAGKRLDCAIEVVGFAEEEGQRFSATFLGSGALTGDFNPAWLDQEDADGITMRRAMTDAGLNPDEIDSLKRNPADYLGFVEIHIEQGPVLNMRDQPLAVVTAINGCVRYKIDLTGLASHAGTTPMDARQDAALAAAQVAIFAEQRARQTPDVVATVGMLEVPGGSINVVPGRCLFSLDVRAPANDVRDEVARDILHHLESVCAERGLQFEIEQTMKAAAAPCDLTWQDRWADAISSLGLQPFRMPSGAGHDAMKLHEVMPQGMMFVRGLNAGISHNPLESITNNDADLAVRAMTNLVKSLKK